MKIFKLISILLLTTLILVGCGDRIEQTPTAVANQFLRNINTVDNSKVSLYKNLLKAPLVPVITEDKNGKEISRTLDGASSEYLEIESSINESIYPLMSHEGYISILRSEFSLLIPRICLEAKNTSKVIEITLGNQIIKDEKNVSYPYEIKLNFISKDNKINEDTMKGVIKLVKQDNKWVVLEYEISQFPTIHLNINNLN